ncbi:MAG TPA: CvpA family protein [Gaiellaceae bacterium]|nr:CvpA family protein [Gaiellaceae bacterium]
MHLTTVDWVGLGVVLLAALGGWRRGLVLSAFSLAGLALGAYAGSRVAPHLLHGGAGSPWTPLAGLIGAVAGAFLLQGFAGFAGSFVRGGLRLTPLRFLDSAGGLLLGAATGLAFVWVAAAVALLAPGQTRLRQEVQRSSLVRRLNDVVPPRTILHLLARVDPFPSIAGPAAPAEPPTTGVLRNRAIHDAATRVVKILGTACGLGVEGSGWFASSDLVVTAAHVVAGERDTIVQIPGVAGNHPADVLVFDVHNDVAILRVADANARPLELVDPVPGASVAIVGYPENGVIEAAPGRIGKTSVVVTRDALGHGPVTRTITAVAGRVRHGNSGGPAIDTSGAVESTMFAARVGAASGYGIPASIVRSDLARATGDPVSTGTTCAG